MKELVSIIVPVYNTEKYIERCIDSILNQSYRNIELIIINDESKDNSEEKYKKYLYDIRVLEIKQRNKGLSGARNTGLKVAKGDYIMFVDSDDWLDQNCVFEVLNVAKRDLVDIVMFPYISEYKNNSIKRELFLKSKEFSTMELRDYVFRRLFGLIGKELKNPLILENFNTAWGKLYKKEILKHKKFIDTKLIGTEDCLFNIFVLYNAKTISYTNKCYYHYRKDNFNSLTKTYKKNLFNQWSTLYKFMEKFLIEKKLSVDFNKALKNRIILNLFSLILNICESSLSLAEKELELKKLLNEKLYIEEFKGFNFKDLKGFWKLYYYLCKDRRERLVLLLTILILQLRGKK